MALWTQDDVSVMHPCGVCVDSRDDQETDENIGSTGNSAEVLEWPGGGIL